jgi:tRNA nucleotidyltransferase (CCA-adding enzyme)
MRIIVGHTSPDFDALASIALCKLIHPGATAVISGSLNSQLTAFLQLYQEILDTYSPDDIELDEVTELIVVDTSDAERISPFDRLIGHVPITLYDHHPRPDNAIPASKGIHRCFGATTTILTLKLKSEGVHIPQALASLGLLGIHEDTGHFSYALTTPEDHEAAAYLMHCGANSELVRRYSGETYAPEHRDILNVMVAEAERLELSGRTVIMSAFDYPQYVSGLAPLVNQLMNLYNADAALLIVHMDDKTFVVGRSNGAVNVGALLSDQLDGGGHVSAGFARTAEAVTAVKEQLSRALPDFLTRLKTASDIMSFPVRTVTDTTSIEAASVLLSQYGHNGLPVVDDADRLVGIITRRTVDKALRHNLASAPVRGIMVKKVITASPDTPLDRLEVIIQTHNVGRIPVVTQLDNATQLKGIVTRSDLIRARHQNGETPARTPLLEQLPYAVSDFLKQAKSFATDARLYLVGGVLRDLLLGVGMTDLDLLIEGISAQQYASRLQRHFGGKLSCHLDFGTCTLYLSGGLVVDIAATREEYYTHPGALPTVSEGTLQKDLARRDFTINAIALRLYPEPLALIDPFGGQTDLNERRLRTLHPLSFTEDPTRMLRGARLAARLGLQWDMATLEQLETTLNTTTLQVSHSRLRAELELTLAERYVAPAIGELYDHQILQKLYGISTVNIDILKQLDAQKTERLIPTESYVLALLLPLDDAELNTVISAFHWPKRHFDARQRLLKSQHSNQVAEQDLARASTAELEVYRVLSPELQRDITHYETLRNQPRLRGQDVLDLGLSPGPLVGTILREVANARRQGHVHSYDEELELARDLIQAHLQERP